MISDFINELPEKYEYMVGEHGSRLSGGQRQKLAIARAILRDSKILLLDEITSDLDSEAEYNMTKLLYKLSKKSTIITISHRLTSILDANQIVVMNEGKIVGIGNHNTLMKECDLYKGLINSNNRIQPSNY